jgi:hypothetical protein
MCRNCWFSWGSLLLGPRSSTLYGNAIQGLLTLEPNIDKQIKYLDFGNYSGGCG